MRDRFELPDSDDGWLDYDGLADDPLDWLSDDFSSGSTRKRNSGQRMLWLAGLVMTAVVVLGVLAWLNRRTLPADFPQQVSSGQPTVTVVVAAGPGPTSVPSTPTPLPDSPAAPLTPTETTVDALPVAVPELEHRDAHDPEALTTYMVELINRDRQDNGLSPVAWDEVAALAGQGHAESMIAQTYFSHWNPEGYGPDHRYSFAGGVHMVMENLLLFERTFEDGRGALIDDWMAVIEEGQAGLMNSPGHRRNILDPAHTHVGIGMAYHEATGQFRLAQEFVNQYVDLRTPLPGRAALGEEIRLQGVFREGLLSNALLDIAFEPFPQPMSIPELERTRTYTSAAESLGDTRRIGLEFDERVTLDYGAGPGLYHIRVFVDLPTGQTQVIDHIIEVR